jgi:hypothetical protein
MRPRHNSRALWSTAMECPAGRLGKRGPWVGESSAVCRWHGFRHLRFVTPAGRALHDPRLDEVSDLLDPGIGSSRRSSRTARAGVANLRCLKPKHLADTNVPPNSRPRLLSPPEQCARIAAASGRRHEGLVGAERRTRPSLGGEAVE